MLVVMYGMVLSVLLAAVVLVATKGTRLVKESLSEIKAASFLPLLITSRIARPDKERVQNNV
jgi:hypothetical protein